MKIYREFNKFELIIQALGLLASLVFIAFFSSGCERGGSPPPDQPDPVAILRDQVETERGLRDKAESSATREAQLRRKGELAIVIISILAMAGFLAGTIIGSRARRHSDERR